MASVTLTSITKRYGTVNAIDDLSLSVTEGEFLVLLGPSGCGKTTTLRTIAGFVEATSGKIEMGGVDITNEPPYRRNIGLVFQNYALFPHLTVFENVAFGLRRRGIKGQDLLNRVSSAIDLVQLGGLTGRMPLQLSGGQQQRVAIARAIAIQPALLLLDEPLSNLDAKLRYDVRQELRRLQKELGITTVMVTHDQEEALSVGNRLVVMNAGKVEQIGSPEELYRAPANRFVASFIGNANFLPGHVHADGVTFVVDGGPNIIGRDLNPQANVLMIRPEIVHIARTPADQSPVIEGELMARSYMGSYHDIKVKVGDDRFLDIRLPARMDEEVSLRLGDKVFLSVRPSDVVGIFDVNS
ncbi:ABC transporter ATP-binding protein [Phyllobacterium sp. SB3]|uniref:ABC transporter ATP-binding protein n=1 Tax=Phyllobacterium sp. SB3 TaxID=3156073 RepID=UPI0032AFA4CF